MPYIFYIYYNHCRTKFCIQLLVVYECKNNIKEINV